MSLKKRKPGQKAPQTNSKYRIFLTTRDIANVTGLSERYLREIISSNRLQLTCPDQWARFWQLVVWLEGRGLRPDYIIKG